MREQLARLSLLSAALAALFALATTARADMGPCKPDGHQGFAHDGLVCGQGVGAARVIDGTLSPDKTLALAWRAAKTPPNEIPDGDKLEMLVVRVADGEILFKTEGDYWDTGDAHINRNQEYANWSTNSRFMVETYHTRFDTETLQVFAFDAAGKLAGTIDLLETVKKAVVAKTSRRVRHADSLTFAVNVVTRKSPVFKDGAYGASDISIANDGRVRMRVYLWAPKEGPFYYYGVTAQVTRAPTFTAKLLSVVEAKAPRE